MKFRSLCIALLALFFTNLAHAQLTYNELWVDYDSVWSFKNMQMVPIRYKPKAKGVPNVPSAMPRPMTLAEAINKKKVKVQEMQYEQGADVNWLQVTNQSNQSVLIQSGEIVEGGKQDRMVGETKFIPPGITDYINVYCVEKRRWEDKPKPFHHRGVANSKVRKAMDVSSRQSEVWKEIDKEFEKENKKSETWKYLDLRDPKKTDTAYIKYFTSKYHVDDSSIAGFIFITGNEIMSTEIFASPGLVELTFPNMLSSYVETAINYGASPNVPVPTLKKFMDKILKDEEEQRTYVTAHGKLHRSEGKVVHLIAYPD